MNICRVRSIIPVECLKQILYVIDTFPRTIKPTAKYTQKVAENSV